MIAEKNFRILRGERAFLIAREMDLFRLPCLRSDELELKNPIIPISSATAPVFGTEDALWKLN